MRNNNAKNMALCGVTAALAVVNMCMGGLIPGSTYICPMLSMIILRAVREFCGTKLAWVWYVAVSILSMLMGPDKEAAGIFLVLGYYPVIKPKLDKLPYSWLCKALVFNVSVVALYSIMIHVVGIAQVTQEFEEMGAALVLATLALGNVVFALLDRLLVMELRKKQQPNSRKRSKKK